MRHVIGANFEYIMHCNHNRRSFVFCCQDMFKSIASDAEFTVNDLHKLYSLICPDLNIDVLQEASLYATHSISDATKFSYGEFQIAFFFQIIFFEWLKLVSPFFYEDGTKRPKQLSVAAAVASFEDCIQGKPDLSFHLPVDRIISTVRSLEERAVSFSQVIEALIASPSIKLFLLSKGRS